MNYEVVWMVKCIMNLFGHLEGIGESEIIIRMYKMKVDA